MNILCTICARGGSKGLKNKALRIIKNKPLIFYSLKVAKESNLFDAIAVSTDSKKIQSTVNKYGNYCWFLRKKKLARDNTPKKLALIDLLKKSESRFKKKFDIIVDLDLSSPLRKKIDLKNSLNQFIRNKNDLLVSANSSYRNPYFNMVEKKNNRLKFVKKSSKIFFARQQAPKVFDLNASINIRTRKTLLDIKNLKMKFTNKSDIFIMSKNKSIDIESKFELKLVEKIIDDKSKK